MQRILEEEARKQNKDFYSNRKKQKKTKKNKEYSVVVYAFMILFVALIAWFVYFNVFQSEKVINNAFNKRQDSFAKEIKKGDLRDRNGEVLATTKVAADGSETRYYPYGRIFSHVVGYSAKGKTGLESLASFSMLRSNASFITRLQNDLSDKKSNGDNVYTTLDAKLQEAAYAAMGDYKGAVVVIEVKTGKVLAMVSKPAYDPNAIEASWDLYTTDKSKEGYLVNRATQGLYPPGSIFKVFTLYEYMQEYSDYEEYAYKCVGSIVEENFKLHCFDGKKHGSLDLTSAFAKSCNSAFADIGLKLNRDKFKETCEKLLFNSELPLELPYSKSSFVLDSNSTTAQTMMTAMGQGETVVSPMHMAMVTAAIANKGECMTPMLIDHIENDAGITVSTNKSQKYKTLLPAADCAKIIEYMKAVVTDGTATALKSVKGGVAGKTGTAEFSSDKTRSHSWFIGFTPVEEPEIAIAAIVEDNGNSGITGVSVTKAVFNAYYANKK